MEPSIPNDGTSRGKGDTNRPKLVGHFRSPISFSGFDIGEQTNRQSYFRYAVRSIHLPVEHHYVNRERKPIAYPPWMALVVLQFHSLEDFAKYNFSWRKNHRKWFDCLRVIDHNAHPKLGGTMFARSQSLDFGTTQRLHWHAEIVVFTPDPQACKRDLTDADVASMFNKNTNVCMQAFYQEMIAEQPVWARCRIFVKYPKEREPSEGAERMDTLVDSIDPDLVHVSGREFCIKRNEGVELEDSVLYSIMKENIERQLFVEEPDEEPRNDEPYKTPRNDEPYKAPRNDEPYEAPRVHLRKAQTVQRDHDEVLILLCWAIIGLLVCGFAILFATKPGRIGVE